MIKYLWNKLSSEDKFIAIRRSAHHNRAIGGFDHIIQGNQVNRTLQVFGRLKTQYQEFDNALNFNEYLFTGNNIYNNLIVLFSYHFSILLFGQYKERVKRLEKNFPRLIYVIIMDSNKSTICDGFNAIFLKEYDSPEDVVKELEKFTVDSKKCVMPNYNI